jgi:murein L,D-transpeptidase YcbB/YkuD
MRPALVFASVIAIVVPLTGLQASEFGPKDDPAPALTADKPILDAATIAILDRLTSLKARRPRGDYDRNLIDQLAALYRSRGGQWFWTSTGRVLPNATSVAEEVRNADRYGLDPATFDLPARADGELDLAATADFEARLSLAVLKYTWHAGGGRIDPSQLSRWLDQRPKPVSAAVVLPLVSQSATPDVMLRLYHPQHPTFERLRQAWLSLRDGKSPGQQTATALPPLMPGPKLRPGDDHPDIAVLRKYLSVPARAGDEELYDDALARAVRAYRSDIGRVANTIIDNKLRASLTSRRAAAAPAAQKSSDLARKLLINMERWRWLPADLGKLHVWNNLPEYETRVVNDNRVVHQERIIIGKPDTQTPVFSDTLRTVVFQPDWGVPPSIKVRTLLPRLQDGDEDVLSEKNMRIVVNGKSVDPARIDWSKTDIRGVPIIQDPGPDNPLGQIKFLFPNKHDVYMHDTPTKGLFNVSTRAFSNGCIRVRNPKRLAELVFEADRGWNSDDVTPLLQTKAPVNNRIGLEKPIPVHNVYFTVSIGDDGKIRSFADVYGHDRRIQDALDGKSIAEIAERDPYRKLQEELEDIAPTKPPAPFKLTPLKVKAKGRG